MVGLVYEAVFRDLRALADWFSTGPQRSSPHTGRTERTEPIERIIERLGTVAIPLLGRELCSMAPGRREAARDALEAIAAQSPTARARVTAELQAITTDAVTDEAKIAALGLLSEFGEHADVRFADPQAIRVRSSMALASHLRTAAELAGAADLMVHRIAPGNLVQLLEVMAEAEPNAAHRLATELGQRLDVPGDVRDRITLLAATIAPKIAPEAEPAEPAAPGGLCIDLVHAAVLVDAAARLVVIASRQLAGARRWRRWVVLVGASGRIEDCLHEEDTGPDGDPASLMAKLCAAGYRLVNTEFDHAHEVVATAARLTARSTHALPSPYYLGRDLLDLGDAHLGVQGRANHGAAVISSALELVAAGDHVRALPLLERCDPNNPDAAAALAALLLAQHRPAAALAALDRALAVEPDWPLHHWNLAAALHQLGDACGCYHALRRFVATSAIPSGLFGDPDQPARVGCAERMIAEIERTARLTGRSLKRRARTARKKRGSASP